jgi:hypothetical protein
MGEMAEMARMPKVRIGRTCGLHCCIRKTQTQAQRGVEEGGGGRQVQRPSKLVTKKLRSVLFSKSSQT